MRYLTLNEMLELYRRILDQSGGSMGIHDLGALESALAQPRMTFGGGNCIRRLLRKHRPWVFSLSRTTPLWMAANAPAML